MSILCRKIFSQKLFKENILETCDKRNDDIAELVITRVHGAPWDLHAADVQYHKDRYTKFTSEINVCWSNASNVPGTKDPNFRLALVITDMSEYPNRLWTSVELYDILLRTDQEDYMAYSGRQLHETCKEPPTS